MTELGFWRMAQADPDRIALIAPDGSPHTAGEVLAAANQISHGLRALGCEVGDTVACVVPNGLEMLEYYLGATQIGLYITPINHHLVGPEIAYIVNDSDAKVLLGHERFAAELEKAAAEIAVPGRAPLRHRLGGWLPTLRRAAGRPADDRPREPHRRCPHALHLGHHRATQGGQARAGGHRS